MSRTHLDRNQPLFPRYATHHPHMSHGTMPRRAFVPRHSTLY